MPAIIFSRIDGSAQRDLLAAAFFWRTTGSAFVARKLASIFSRATGSAHLALAASLTFARLAGLRSPARIFAAIMGSAQRAFTISRRLSPVSGVSGVSAGRGRLGVLLTMLFVLGRSMPGRPAKWTGQCV